MSNDVRIALVGDFSPEVTAHIAIPKALEIAGVATGRPVSGEWISTESLIGRASELLADFDALWCVPASPYVSMEGALEAIRFARESHKPFLGTCGGYQHAVLEYARTVLGYAEADNAEVNSEAAMPLIGPLSCALVEQSDRIKLRPGSYIADLYARESVSEKYHCSYGLNPHYLPIFDTSDLLISGLDSAGEPRAVELKSHPFFIGTAFQPERSALEDQTHPVITAFAQAASGRLALCA